MDYKQFILKEFESRKSKNKYYSLRAFARDLDLSPSTLSEVLNSKHAPSQKTMEKVVLKLGLEIDVLKDLYSSNKAVKRKVMIPKEVKIRKSRKICISPADLAQFKRETQLSINILISKFENRMEQEHSLIDILETLFEPSDQS